MKTLKVRTVRRILLQNGYKEIRRRGSHRMYEGSARGRRKVIPLLGKEGDDVRAPLLQMIIRQTGLSPDLFR